MRAQPKLEQLKLMAQEAAEGKSEDFWNVITPDTVLSLLFDLEQAERHRRHAESGRKNAILLMQRERAERGDNCNCV
jgi:hypothetical protein